MTSTILQGLSFSVTDGLSLSVSDFLKIIKDHGGDVSYMITSKTTHLIATPTQVSTNSFKVKSALEKGILIVSEKFVEDSIAANSLLDPTPYILTGKETPTQALEFTYEKEFQSEEELLAQKEKEKREKETIQKLQERIVSTKDVTKRKPREVPLGPVAKVRVFKDEASDAPYFPKTFELVYYKTLQWTDVKENHNKYYALELHKAEESGNSYFRLYTHYGRTDDLVGNSDAGRRECRYYKRENEAEDGFASIYQEKTGKKGYRPVDLMFSNIGSSALKKLLQEVHGDNDTAASDQTEKIEIPSQLGVEVQALIKLLYQDATNELSNTLGPAKITSKGIETPLGVVTITQIEKGESILQELYQIFQSDDESSKSRNSARISDLTNEFYTTIPHNIGRSKTSVQTSVLNKVSDFSQKEELLQLMRDMLNVTVESKGVQKADIDMKYAALKTQITHLKRTSNEYKEIHNYIVQSQVGPAKIKIANIFSVKRDIEEKNFVRDLFNQRWLFHGSRASNFVGLLSRGVLLPKLVVSLGGKRRDAGLLGNGIYFGDSVTTSAQYTSPGSKGTRFMLVSQVALGSTKQYTTVQYGLTEPPSGYHSVQGVRRTETEPSDFKDDEFVIFNTNLQKQVFLVEFDIVDYGADVVFPNVPVRTGNSDLSTTLTTNLTTTSLSSSSKTTSKLSSLRDSLQRVKAKKRTFGVSGLEKSVTWGGTSEITIPNEPPKDTTTLAPVTETETETETETSSSSATVDSTDITATTDALTTTSTSLRKSLRGSKYSSGLLNNTLQLQPSTLTHSGLVVLSCDPVKSSAETATSSTTTEDATSTLFSSTRPFGRDIFKSYKPKPTRFGKPVSEPTSAATTTITTQTTIGLTVGSTTFGLTAVPAVSATTETTLSTTETTGVLSTAPTAEVPETDPSDKTLAQSRKPLSKSGRLSTDENKSSGNENLKSLRKSIGQFSFDKLSSKITLENAKMKRAEDQLRECFVSDRDHFRINDPYVSLINVFKRPETFLYARESPEELQIPKLLTKLRLPGHTGSSVVGKEKFGKHFESFTCGVFKGISWENILIAGGSVLGPLMNVSEKTRDRSFRDSDIDIFVYGLTPEQAQKKVEDIFFRIQTNTNASGEVVRTKNSLTIIGQYPVRHVQIVLRLYKSPAEILMGFDIDCCAIGFDGEDVWALPRAARALTKRYNLVDMSRRSLTYESRLYKYSKRGFAVAVPGLLRPLLRPSLYDFRPWQVNGLAQLILFEHAMTNPGDRYSNNSKDGSSGQSVSDSTSSDSVWRPKGHRLRAYKKDDFSEDRINEYQQIDQIKSEIDVRHDSDSDHDYSNLYLPWGPQWFTDQIVRELLFRDKAQWATTGKHVVFVGLQSILTGKASYLNRPAIESEKKEQVESRGEGNLEENLETGCGIEDKAVESLPDTISITGPQTVPDLPSPDSPFVSGPLAWLQENPGRQLLTGSFHPVTDDHWYDLAFNEVGSRDEFVQTLTGSVFEGALSRLKTVLRRNRNQDVNQVDLFPEWSRTALNHACALGDEDSVRELISFGADISLRDSSTGLCPIHFSVIGGNTRVVEVLLQRKVDVNSVSPKQQWTPLHFAAYYGQLEILKLFLDDGSTDISMVDRKGRTALYLAAMGGKAECVRALLAAGVQPWLCASDSTSPLQAASKRGHVHAAVLLARKVDQYNVPLNTLEVFSKSIPNAVLQYKLLAAVSSGNVVSVKVVIASEKDFKEKQWQKKAAERDSLTAEEKSKKKYSVGIEVHGIHRVNALHVAAARNFPEIVKLLLEEAPSLVNMQDQVGQTALHHAIRNLSIDAARALLSWNASNSSTAESSSCNVVDIEATNQYGQSPMYYVLSMLTRMQFPSEDLKGEFPPHFDDVDGLPFASAKDTLEALKVLLKSRGAQRPPLNYFGALPKNPNSEFLNFDPIARPSERVISREEFDKIKKIEEEEEQKIKEENKRFETFRPSVYMAEFSPEQAQKKIRRSEEFDKQSRVSPVKPWVSPKTVSFEIGASSPIEKPKKRVHFSPVGSDTATSFSFQTFSFPTSSTLTAPKTASPPASLPDFSTINMANASKFALPSQKSHEPVVDIKSASITKLESIARSFSSSGNPSTLLSRVLLQISKLFKSGYVTQLEKDALKTMAIQQHRVLFGAYLVYESDKDESEFVDTVHKICHLAYKS